MNTGEQQFLAADVPECGIGRGSGMTLKAIIAHLKAAEKRRGIGSQRWRLKARIVPLRKTESRTPAWHGKAESRNGDAAWREKLKRIVGGIHRAAGKN